MRQFLKKLLFPYELIGLFIKQGICTGEAEAFYYSKKSFSTVHS
jgi:hypothetical protein